MLSGSCLHIFAGLLVENAKTSAIFERLILASNVKTDAALAQAIGVTPQSVSDARKKSKVPPAWAIEIAKKYQVSLDWILFGKEVEFFGSGLAAGQARSAGRGELEIRIAGLEAENAALKEALVAKQEALNAYKELLKITRANILETFEQVEPADTPTSAPQCSSTNPTK
jgi:plasmid maintenance system antidote protein VapI